MIIKCLLRQLTFWIFTGVGAMPMRHSFWVEKPLISIYTLWRRRTDSPVSERTPVWISKFQFGNMVIILS